MNYIDKLFLVIFTIIILYHVCVDNIEEFYGSNQTIYSVIQQDCYNNCLLHRYSDNNCMFRCSNNNSRKK